MTASEDESKPGRLLTPPPEEPERLGDVDSSDSHAVLDETTDGKKALRLPPAISIANRDRSQTIPSHVPQPTASEEETKGSRRATDTPADSKDEVRQTVLKLSPIQIQELTTSPGSLPLRVESPFAEDGKDSEAITESDYNTQGASGIETKQLKQRLVNGYFDRDAPPEETVSHTLNGQSRRVDARPKLSTRGLSEPFTPKRNHAEGDRESSMRKRTAGGSSRKYSSSNREDSKDLQSSMSAERQSAALPTLPLPPFSMPTYLQLELSSERPSPLYIHPSHSNEFVYESSRVKFERLLNFLMLPPQLEQVLVFGTLTCLDAWLYMFTILPLRFLTAIWILITWATSNVTGEVRYVAGYIYQGIGRLWHRRRTGPPPTPTSETESDTPDNRSSREPSALKNEPPSSSRKPVRRPSAQDRGHKRSRSIPSLLQPNHKADLLQGLLIIIGCAVLMRFDASRMYHSIRGQAAIKLYVIYNVLEVLDRLFSALGQDILECLFSRETLERKPNGRSKIIRPLWLFVLALLYSVMHSTALFYQVITLNVAVNSYSNALLTLLMSNQFVEIKGTVFKRIEKENLFQLTCADIVERFQLWLMLLIIALRNIVELGGLSISLSSSFSGPFSSGATASKPTTTNTSSSSWFSPKAYGFLPNSFTILPSLPFQVLGPFLVVLGSEMLVDWVKHAYITKFNATSAKIYGRFFDVLAKDYYSHAFAEQTLTRRLGLPLIPLACLFIRATLQTYHMFLATNIAPPLMSTATSLATHNESANATASPAFAQIDAILRRALGSSPFGGASSWSFLSYFKVLQNWTLDDGIALAAMLVVFLCLYFILLALKLMLGMVLLSWSRTRYAGMKAREAARYIEPEAKRTGAWSTAEVGEARRGIIYDGDDDGLRRVRERETRARDTTKSTSGGSKSKDLEGVVRYSMLSKRIW